LPAYYGDFVVPELLAEVADWDASVYGPSPSNAARLLTAAAALVLDATNMAYYNVDSSTGLATDTQIAGALTMATVIQAAAWAAIGYDPAAGGVQTAAVVQSSKAGGASDTFADANIAAQARQAAITGLVPDAVRVLRLNNLLIPNPWVFG